MHLHLDIIAFGVTFSDAMVIANCIVGASFSITPCVAPGVMSWRPNPVPPVVSIKFNPRLSAQSHSTA